MTNPQVTKEEKDKIVDYIMDAIICARFTQEMAQKANFPPRVYALGCIVAAHFTAYAGLERSLQRTPTKEEVLNQINTITGAVVEVLHDSMHLAIKTKYEGRK